MSNSIPVGIRSLTVSAPEGVRTNDELRARFPELIRRPEDSTLGRIMSNNDSRPDMMRIDTSIEPYLNDPFRGVTERRILGPHESSIDLEVAAGAKAIELAGLAPGDPVQPAELGPHQLPLS